MERTMCLYCLAAYVPDSEDFRDLGCSGFWRSKFQRVESRTRLLEEVVKAARRVSHLPDWTLKGEDGVAVLRWALARLDEHDGKGKP